MILFRELFESLRYVNHLWPLLILRLYVGFFFINKALLIKASGYLTEPRLSAAVDEILALNPDVPAWIQNFYTLWVQENWLFWSKAFVNIEWVVGVFLVIGLLSRPVGLIALIYIFFISFVSTAVDVSALQQVSVMILVLIIFGAGRVGGLDYFFYKRQRGLIW